MYNVYTLWQYLANDFTMKCIANEEAKYGEWSGFKVSLTDKLGLLYV